MKKFNLPKLFGLMLTLLVIVGLFYGGDQFVFVVANYFGELDPEILAAIIGGMATVFAGLAAVIISQKQAKQRDIDESHRAKKVEIYKGFLNVVSRLMTQDNDKVSKSKRGIKDQELIDYIVDFKSEILLWGSPEVIKCQLEFERASKIDNEKIFISVDNLYKAIRKDIGLSNKGLDNYELMRMYLKDPDELDTIIRK